MYSKFWTHLSQRDHWGSSKDAWKMLNMKHRVFEITIRIFRIHPGLLVYSYHLISILLPVMFSFITFFGVRWSPKSFPQKCTKRPRLATSSGDVAWPVPTLPVPLSVALPCGKKKKVATELEDTPSCRIPWSFRSRFRSIVEWIWHTRWHLQHISAQIGSCWPEVHL